MKQIWLVVLAVCVVGVGEAEAGPGDLVAMRGTLQWPTTLAQIRSQSSGVTTGATTTRTPRSPSASRVTRWPRAGVSRSSAWKAGARGRFAPSSSARGTRP